MKTKIVELLNAQIECMDSEEINSLLEIPPKVEMGDFAFPCFKLAKVFRKAPPMIAADLKDKIGCPDFLSKVECLGGYLNFFVDKSMYAKQIVDNYLSNENYGGSDEGKGKTICIDYSSRNVAKIFMSDIFVQPLLVIL